MKNFDNLEHATPRFRELVGELRGLSREANLIAELAREEGRDVTGAELRRVEGLNHKSEILEGRLEELGSQSQGRKCEPNMPFRQDDLTRAAQAGFRNSKPTAVGRPRFRDPKTGEVLQTILPGESLAATVRSDGLDPSNLFEALFTGDAERGNRELAALGMQGSIDSSGGFLLPVGVSASVFDAVRAAAVVAGQIPIISMGTADLAIAKLDSDVGSQWLGERVQQTDRSPTFGRMTLRARTLRSYCEISEELLEDASNVGEAITSAIAASFATKLDAAVISGQSDGDAGSPAGLRVLSGLVDVGAVGTPNFDDFSSAYFACRTANPPPGAQIHAVMHPRSMTTLDQAKEATTNAYLSRSASFVGKRDSVVDNGGFDRRGRRRE